MASINLAVSYHLIGKPIYIAQAMAALELCRALFKPFIAMFHVLNAELA